MLASDAVDGLIDDGLETATLLARGPSFAGIAVIAALGIGLRNGADGGPVSIESADVAHLLMSPVDRTRIMLRPIAQRFRSVAFASAIALGVLGQLAAREIDGSRAAWAGSGALFGVLLAVAYVGAAVIAHAGGLPGIVASTVSMLLIAWQVGAAAATWGTGNLPACCATVLATSPAASCSGGSDNAGSTSSPS